MRPTSSGWRCPSPWQSPHSNAAARPAFASVTGKTVDFGVASTRQKAGQVEGAIEAFANIYAGAAELVRARREGRAPAAVARLCPGVGDGLAGMAFIEACVRSSRDDGAWVAPEAVA